jgi:hypothetical protein
MTPENRLDLPALMTCAAIELRRQYNVPVGLVIRCESSSPAGFWLGRDTVESDSAIQGQIEAYRATGYQRLLDEYPAKLAAWEKAVAKAKAEGGKEPLKPAAPALPGGQAFGSYTEGVQELYGANYASHILSSAPYAVRGMVWDQGESGTGIGGADLTVVLPALVGDWRGLWGRPVPFIYVDKKCLPAGLFEIMGKLPATGRVEYTGLSTINHPPDKAVYAHRVFLKMLEMAPVK